MNTTTVYPIAKPSLLASATDAELTHAINKAHSLGMRGRERREGEGERKRERSGSGKGDRGE